MNLKFIKTFLLVAQTGSLSRAAEQLHTTLGAVSARIQNLEDELGTPLFDRGGRHLRLTDKARSLMPLAQQLVRMADDFEGQAKAPASYEGRIRLGIIDTAAIALLPSFLRELERRYPKVEIDLQADTSQRIAERVHEGQLDLGITLVGSEIPSARSIPLLGLALHWVAAPGLIAHDEEVSLKELASHAILSFAQGSIPHEFTKAMFAPVGGCRRMYCGTSMATTIRLAKQGLGVSVMSAALLEDELASGLLKIVRAAPPLKSLDIQISYKEGAGSYLLRALAHAAVDVAHDFCEGVRQQWAWPLAPKPEALQ